ncbi:hypothetical protein GGR88_000286 [Sphingomonas jejuensis]|uniref:Phage terminase small subunit n=1 Tax=Sphingomonas jejuensis TaxID=904715 RepID=A0ABX0XIX3_9SPHN|nr:hypothetical protein [Sphingomonas jejuensis]NJC32812.1 hypothetical protein [Sphingomonas jejuensis]
MAKRVERVRRGTDGRARVERVSPIRWTAAKQREFLAMLADTANVSRSARSVGMSDQSAYALRRRDAGFRQAWLEALSEGFDKLEMMLLERAMTGTPKEHLTASGGVAVTTEFSERLALNLLAQHRAAVQRARQEEGRTVIAKANLSAVLTVDAEQVRADLIAKLELMGLRLSGRDSRPGEVADGGSVPPDAA